MTTLIVNADDLGRNAGINAAIAESFEPGLCSSATLMPNMPAFEEACQIAHEKRLLNHVGIHLVLSDGHALTKAIRRLPRFCDADGTLATSRSRPVLWLDDLERRALAEEIRAQIDRCRAFGIPLTHLDSHYHIHTEWAICSVVLAVVREQRIPYLRLSRNCGAGMGLVKGLYKKTFNQRLASRGLAKTHLFGSIWDYLYWERRAGAGQDSQWVEVMTHPYRGPTGQLTDAEDGRSLEETVRLLPRHREAVSYSGARYGSP